MPARKYLYNVLSKSGPQSDEDWVPGPETIAALESSKILYAPKISWFDSSHH